MKVSLGMSMGNSFKNLYLIAENSAIPSRSFKSVVWWVLWVEKAHQPGRPWRDDGFRKIRRRRCSRRLRHPAFERSTERRHRICREIQEPNSCDREGACPLFQCFVDYYLRARSSFDCFSWISIRFPFSNFSFWYSVSNSPFSFPKLLTFLLWIFMVFLRKYLFFSDAVEKGDIFATINSLPWGMCVCEGRFGKENGELY